MGFLATWTLPAGLGDELALFLIVGSAAALLLSLAKAGFGGSMGILAVPMMIYACDGHTQLALGMILPLLIACDYVAIVKYWRQWRWRPVWLLLPGVVLGILAGWATLRALLAMGAGGADETTDAALALGIGSIAVIFVVLQAIRSLRKRPLPFRPVLWQGTCFGAAAGFTTTVAHAAGPITTMYMIPQQLPKRQFVASLTLYALIGNHLKLVPYLSLGMIRAEVVTAAAMLVPAVVAGALLGVYLNRRVRQRDFTAVVYTLLLLAGADLIYDAVRTLWG